MPDKKTDKLLSFLKNGQKNDGNNDDNKPPNSLLYAWRQIRKIIILIVGSTITLIGIVMLVTPGPAIVVIPIGLGILAIEFVWARNLLKKFKEKAIDARDKIIKK
ncbi:MAG: hypothetical protein DRQ51_00400 [Gammaproteobacteria bacterium]|nr:MAG: hypothetical protein DRQ51_00400 [Gammaproteobacteria bacterium]